MSVWSLSHQLQIHWIISDDELKAVRDLFTTMEGNNFVVQRLQDNVTGNPPRFHREEFWRVMVGCLLTTQQRSGPDSAVTRFLRRKPFCPSLQDCSVASAEILLRAELSSFGGIRRGDTIAKQGQANLAWLESGGWKVMEDTFDRLHERRASTPRWGDVAGERSAADVVRENLHGFGPKQSRNFWQWLGTTRYEIRLIAES
jgi:N-glycosylase/DNA lyase